MLKVYTYQPEEIGLQEWPAGTLRLVDTEEVSPEHAQLFLCPGPLTLFPHKSSLDRFSYIREHESRHVFFDVSDSNNTHYEKQCVFIRCNLKQSMKAADPNSISFPWPVEDFEEVVSIPEGGFKFDVSFHGWLSSETRIAATRSCLGNAELRCDFTTYSDFTGYIYHTPEGERRRREFRRSMKESRVALCPESIPGDFPYRFFEAMSAGRIPIMVGSDYVLPFEDEIPYRDFTIQCWRARAPEVSRFILDFLKVHSDEQVMEMGRMARAYWVKYLNRDDWPRMMTYAVKKQLGL